MGSDGTFSVGDHVLYFDPDDDWLCEDGQPAHMTITRSKYSKRRGPDYSFPGAPPVRVGTYDIESRDGSVGCLNIAPKYLQPENEPAG